MAVKRKFAAGGSTDPQSARKRTWKEALFGGEDAAVSKAQYKREMNVGKDPKKQVLSSAEVSRSEKSRMNPTQRPYDAKSSPKKDAIKAPAAKNKTEVTGGQGFQGYGKSHEGKNAKSLMFGGPMATINRFERSKHSKEHKEKLKDEGFRDRFAGLIQGDVYGGRTRGGKSDSAAKQEAPSSNSSAKSNLSAPSSPKDKITRQMQGRNPDKKPSSTANAGKKADKPTKQVKQGGYKGNWVNAGPAKKPRSLQEAVRGADAGASFLRGRLTGRNR